jgi:hypothetical protein
MEIGSTYFDPLGERFCSTPKFISQLSRAEVRIAEGGATEAGGKNSSFNVGALKPLA